MTKRIKIGFPLSRGGGGPTIFMKRVRAAVKRNGKARATYFFDPFTDVLICSNAVRNPWKKPFVLRVDGIAFDHAVDDEEINRRNKPIFEGIDNSAGVIFQSRHAYNLICAFHKIPDIPTTIIPNGVDLDQFSPHGCNYRKRLGIEDDEVVFLSSAKWRAHKRLDHIIKAFVRFSEEVEYKTRLLILGELDKIPLQVNENIHFMGHIAHEELPDWYRTADICLFFSWLDNCPNTVVEAIASGLPVVCTNQGGTKELIELTQSGIVVEADKPFAFEKIDLYNPPEPDADLIHQAIKMVVSDRHKIKAGIKRGNIGIDKISTLYTDFMWRVIKCARS